MIRGRPNAANLKAIHVLSHPFEFRVVAAGMILCTYVCDLGNACPERGSFCDIAADLLGTNDQVFVSRSSVR